MDFSDPHHSAAELVFQGAEEAEPAARCDERLIAALQAWAQRAKPTDPGLDHFHLDDAPAFVVSYQGEVLDYWPDEAKNWLAEAVVRDFLFRDGICLLEDLVPRFFDVKYKVQALSDDECLLVCPYPTDAGNIGGIVVVCADHYLLPAGGVPPATSEP